MQNYFETLFGVKSYATLVMAFFGAAISLSYVQELSRLRLFFSLCGGTAAAINAAPLLVYYFQIPEALEHAVAFFAGLLAMRAFPVLLAMVDRLRGIPLPGLPEKKE